MSNTEQVSASTPNSVTADRTARTIAWVGLAVAVLALGNSLFGPIKISFSVGDEVAAMQSGTPQLVAQGQPPTENVVEQQQDATQMAAAAVVPELTVPVAPTPAPAASPSGDIEIFTHQNVMYAFDPVTGTWFSFDQQTSSPIPLEYSQVPLEVRNGTVAAMTVDDAAVGDTQELEQRALSSITATTPGADPELRINHLLQDEPTATTIIEALDRLPGIQIIGGPNDDAPLYVFYDPRCPYCHAAYRELEGRVSMRFIPTLALGAGAEDFSAAILGAIDVTRSADGQIDSVALAEDPDRLARLDTAMRADFESSNNNILTMSDIERTEHEAMQSRMAELRQMRLSPGSEEEQAHEFVLQQTYTVMRQLYGSQQNLLAVPTAIMPRADGTARAYRGIDEATIALITADAVGHTQ